MVEKTVLIGMSGGVDSSVSAYLLKQQGYHVIGVNLRLWDGDGRGAGEVVSHALSAVEDVRQVCEKIGIDYMVLDFKQEFEEKVIDYFVREYENGRTPNPCCMCNKQMKFKQLLEKADELGADYIATGHYARVIYLKETGRYSISFAVSGEKDQSYALCGLKQDQLRRTLMPLGGYTKPEVRKIAEEAGLITAHKKESQDVCFIEDNDYVGFIERRTGRHLPKGKFVWKDGSVVGIHEGMIKYTIGQRKGLKIALGKPVFVIGLDRKNNRVILGDNKDTFHKKLIAGDMNFMSIEDLVGELRVSAKIRYKHDPALCTVRMREDGFLECVFDEPQRAITPGQIIVLYKDDVIVGGGTIVKGMD